MHIFRLAWRYANARWVNYAAVIAVALAVMVQIVVMAVLDGMLDDMKNRVRSMGEQIAIWCGGDLPTQAEFAVTRDVLQEDPRVRGVTPLLRDYGLLSTPRKTWPVILYGIDLSAEATYSELPGHLDNLKLDRNDPRWKDPDKATSTLPGLFLGAGLAERLNLIAGDTVRLVYWPRNARPDVKPVRKRFEVASTFRSGSPISDEYVAFVPIDEARDMVLSHLPQGQRDRVGVLSLWLHDIEEASEMKDRVARVAVSALQKPGRDLGVTTWEETWYSLAQGMAHENMLQEVILVLMNLSGGFCVFAIIATLVARRVRDVGLLRCIGTSRLGVVAVFLLVGLMIGVVGAGLGTAGGYFLTGHTTVQSANLPDRVAPRIDAYWEQVTGYPLYPPRMFGVQGAKGLPVKVNHIKVLLYVIGAIMISVLAAVYPAVWAGLREPVEALRDE